MENKKNLQEPPVIPPQKMSMMSWFLSWFTQNWFEILRLFFPSLAPVAPALAPERPLPAAAESST